MTPERLAPVLALVLALMLGGCERASRGADHGAVDANNALEIAARDRGIVRVDASPLTGVFENRHELGRDALCAVPDGEGRWRFGVTAAFGPGLSCAARGSIVREGDGWRMRFVGVEGCDALVREDEDELALPGNLPSQCDSLCPARASLAGLRLPRASWSEADARRLQIRDGRGNMIRPCS